MNVLEFLEKLAGALMGPKYDSDSRALLYFPGKREDLYFGRTWNANRRLDHWLRYEITMRQGPVTFTEYERDVVPQVPDTDQYVSINGEFEIMQESKR